jgi:DNA-binding PadR family transcriptional regulator
VADPAAPSSASPTPGPAPGLNATSASVLGLLAIEDWPRPWTTYELAKQAGRSLGWFWPRAERQLYTVPERLVAKGYAESHEHQTGNRPATRFVITPAGRAALRGWLDGPGAPVRVEAEELVRVFFADQAGPDELRATLRRMLGQVEQDRRSLAQITAGTEPGAVTGRHAVNALALRLVADLQDAVRAWALWALDDTADWAYTSPDGPEAGRIGAGVRAAAAETGVRELTDSRKGNESSGSEGSSSP